VELTIHDVARRQIRTLVREDKSAGRHEAVWHGLDAQGLRVASGVYMYKIRVNAFEEIKRMTLLK